MDTTEKELIRLIDASLTMEEKRIQEIRTSLSFAQNSEMPGGTVLGALYNIQVMALNMERIRLKSKYLLDFHPEAAARLRGERWGRTLRSYKVYFRQFWRSFWDTLSR